MPTSFFQYLQDFRRRLLALQPSEIPQPQPELPGSALPTPESAASHARSFALASIFICGGAGTQPGSWMLISEQLAEKGHEPLHFK
ncbi:hypothetical protein NPIL_236511 [Nephila pilipes]|uniref:Uncharacterized protein n=1 Tax=Nephila pilipes TaxID=299642 RepID=A0A8X6TDD2_NEPPI|nr:hypothetical protein NPIL_236511 [Nephila pilipes]